MPTIQEEIETCKRMLEHKQNEYNELQRKYSGVRPSWVSGDLGRIWSSIEYYKEKISELEGKLVEDDGFITVHPKSEEQ